MIKFPNKQPTLYGFSNIASILIDVNLYLSLKIIKVDNKKKLKFVKIASFIMLYIEILCILFIFQGSVNINWDGIIYILMFTVFLFYICRSCLPYWEDERA